MTSISGVQILCLTIFKIRYTKRMMNLSACEPVISSKPRSKSIKKTPYIDYKILRTSGGNGGNGGCTFLHLYGNSKGGTGGGNGGNGGHIIFKASHNTKSLSHLLSNYQAEHGQNGGNNNCDGKNGEDLVPLGTLFVQNNQDIMNKETMNKSPDHFDETSKIVAELDNNDDMFIVSRGGSGGKGNSFFVDSVNQSPLVYEKGAKGEINNYLVEMRTIAHFGLVGFPNAGKSTLLRTITRANPKVAPYPFTTLRPNVGMLQYSDGLQLAMADLPGLIQGSHANNGLGYRFLRHAQRCLKIIFVIDFSTPPHNSASSLESFEKTLVNEGEGYDYNTASVGLSPDLQFATLTRELDLYFEDKANFYTKSPDRHLGYLATPTTPSPEEIASHNRDERNYEYVVVGTKFDVEPNAGVNLELFRQIYPDISVFPISSHNKYNVLPFMTWLRQMYNDHQK